MLTPAAAHMPPFTFVTASGLVKLSGSDPPANAGRILIFRHGHSGVFLLARFVHSFKNSTVIRILT